MTTDEMLWAIRDNRTLSSKAKLVWMMLLSRGDICCPSTRTIAADCGISRPTAAAAISELMGAGWLKRAECKSEEGDLDPYSYTVICPGQPWVVKPLDHPPAETSSSEGGGKATLPPVVKPLDHGGKATLPEDNQNPTSVVTTSVGAPKRSTPKRGTRVPEDFIEQVYADKKLGEWFRKECPDVSPRVQNQKFMNHWKSAPGQRGVKLDWKATWRNWMLKAQEDADQAKPRSAAAPGDDNWVQPVSPFRGLP